MSGSDGIGHNSGAHETGSINGTSGRGGSSSGSGTDPNSGSGWGTTHTPNGDIHNYNPGEFGGGNHSGGNNGSHSGGSGNSSSSGIAMAFGFPALAAPGVGSLTISGEAVLSAALTDAFAALKGPFKFGVWGIALYGIMPTEIAKDDPLLMSKIVTSLPADTVTDTQVGSLPLDQATVSVNKRLADVVKDERQHLAVVTGVPMSVPVVDAKPSLQPKMFRVSVPGLPILNVNTERSGAPVSTTLLRGFTEDKDRTVRQSDFTFGGNTRDLVVRFPADSGEKPIYISVMDVLRPDQVKQRQNAENQYQANFYSMLDRARQLAQSQSVGAANTEELRAAFIRDRAGFRPADLEAINAELDRATVAETGYQANYRSMLERARQLAQSQSVGAANTEELRAAFIRDRAGFRAADLEAINAELDRATVAETGYQANYRSMLERARQLAQSQSVGAANTEELRAAFIRDRAGFRPADLEAINAELDRATVAETGYQANYRSMLERARQLAQSQSVGAANTEELRAAFIRDRAGFRPADLEAINAELDRATVAETGYQANYRSMLERARQLAQSQSVGAANTEELRAAFIRDRAGFRPADLEAINAELDRATIEQEKIRHARQAAADKLKAADVQSVRGTPDTVVPSTPLSWAVASAGCISLGGDVADSVSSRLVDGLAELHGIATENLVGPVAVTVASLLYSRYLGAKGGIIPGRDISALMPGDALGLPDSTVLNHAADEKTSISMPVRGRMILHSDGLLDTQLVRTPVAGSVPVVRGVLDEDTGYWGFTLPMMPGLPGQSILVSPSDAPGVNGPLGLTGPVPLPETFVHTGDPDFAPQGVATTVTPVADDLEFSDLILIFPAESGLKSLYVMLRNPRNMPGTASGRGQQVGDNWLTGAGIGNGAPIPSKIADNLRGREFGSFDAFRRAVWGEVGKEPSLSGQFSGNNRKALDKGYSPFPPEAEQVGGRIRYELHHITPIKDGGDVYDVDNIGVLTPKRHIDLHKNGE
ncbi:colicin-like bacteriocin tRNase domain-containing protein [Yokenella regensburgei]|uniref:colicin-like bacteriocin tRNase domain-containing protein n=1 Tax=Yokenella regensburgei TaxID=158877 RepID=UPI0031D3289B